MKLWGVVGWKDAGKTGLMERLVAEFVSRGLSVSTIKHAHHGFDVDQPGKDSFRHREAGASEVLVASAARYAIMHELRATIEPSLEDLVARLALVDLVLVEGYKRDRHPKIEAWRAVNANPLIAEGDDTVRAIASDTELDLDKPVFDLDDTKSIADFIFQELRLCVRLTPSQWWIGQAATTRARPHAKTRSGPAWSEVASKRSLSICETVSSRSIGCAS